MCVSVCESSLSRTVAKGCVERDQCVVLWMSSGFFRIEHTGERVWGGTFFGKIRGDDFLKIFFRQFSQNRPKYPVNFDRVPKEPAFLKSGYPVGMLLRGAKFLAKNLRGLKIIRKNLRGLKIIRKILRGLKIFPSEQNKGCETMRGAKFSSARENIRGMKFPIIAHIAHSIVFTVTGQGGRCGNRHFCGDVILEWPLRV